MSIKIALAGNPNCGKTTLFNALTGSNQFVGNWPGVTVEKKEGKLKGHKDVTIMDLPGIYSLSPYTLEEVVARNYLINEMPDAIINIVDGTNLERNLYLSTQIMELGIPVVMAINMMDLVQKSGNKIHIDKLSKKLGCEVVEISALKGTGIMKAAEKAISAAQSKKKTIPVHEFAQDVEDAIKSVENKLTGTVAEAQKRFFAIKLIEKDDKIVEQMKSVPDVSYEVKALEDKFDDDTESIITNERYVYISSIIGQCYTKSSTGKKLTTSDKIDRIVTNRWLALPIFAVVMWVVYYVSVTTVGTIVTDWTNDVLFGEIIPPAVESALEAVNCAAWLQGLILDGIVAGVGAVLGFVPQMLVLFLFLAFLESCGYMARVAFIMDRIFRKFGLSGKSFIPMLMDSGGNCGSQSSTLIIRGIALGEITFRDIFKVMFKEFRISIIVGVILALANGLRILLMYKNFSLAVVISISLVITVIFAKLIGCILPLLAKKLHFDPAIMASPLITTIVDTCSILIYFNVATVVFHL